MASNTPKALNPGHLTSEERQFLTKRPCYNNLVIDSHELAKRVSLSHPRQWTSAKQPCAGFGMLDKLPLEIQFQLFAVTPISALFDLRATNSHAKQLINQWEPFRTVMTEGANAVRSLLATGAGNLWTTQQVVDVLFTANCEFCGEHGEILQLLKLKRCCFRCLSHERELLAVSERYASSVMKLSHEELPKLPHLCTVPQNSFWGSPVDQRRWMFDYNAALDVLCKRPRPQGPRPAPPATLGRLPLKATGKQLMPEERSVQGRPKSTILARRCRQPLRLLGDEVSPLETIYAQHACAVRVPAKARKITPLPSGGLKTEITTIEAVHCAGCAFYWNYHSALPWQFHKLYPHEKRQKDTPLTRHLDHCVYARLQWSWVHNPWRETHPEDMIVRTLGNQIQTRTGEHPGARENSRFEEIPNQMKLFMAATEVDSKSFVPQYTWPQLASNDDDAAYPCVKEQSHAAEELLDRIRASEPPSPIEKPDHYWDCLVSQEAVSQANWACANLANANMCLFGGPVAVMMEKHKRLLRRGCRLISVGLNEMYL